jgi:hypothetical protein
MPTSSGNERPAIGISEQDDGLDPEAMLIQHQEVEKSAAGRRRMPAEKVPAEVDTIAPTGGHQRVRASNLPRALKS